MRRNVEKEPVKLALFTANSKEQATEGDARLTIWRRGEEVLRRRSQGRCKREAVSLARMFLVALLLLTPAVCGEAADQKVSGSQEAPAPAPPPPPVIPLAEVASR